MTRPPGAVHEDTVLMPRTVAGGPPARVGVPSQDAADSPVFVDASGRRQRRVRRFGWVLVVPAVAYVLLLVSTLLGGPTVRSPLLPAPPPPAVESVAPVAEPGPESPSPEAGGTPSKARTGPAATPSAVGGRAATASSSAAPAPSSPATAVPAPSTAAGSHGKPSSAPGQSGKATARP
jgi:hypothetical protein